MPLLPIELTRLLTPSSCRDSTPHSGSPNFIFISHHLVEGTSQINKANSIALTSLQLSIVSILSVLELSTPQHLKHFQPNHPQVVKMAAKGSAVADEPVDILFALHPNFNLMDMAGPLEVLTTALHDANDKCKPRHPFAPPPTFIAVARTSMHRY
jgi:hypothetical protein